MVRASIGSFILAACALLAACESIPLIGCNASCADSDYREECERQCKEGDAYQERTPPRD